MTTKEAVAVAKIMVSPKLRATTRVIAFLRKFKDIDLVEFFNEMDASWSTADHDFVLSELGRRR